MGQMFYMATKSKASRSKNMLSGEWKVEKGSKAPPELDTEPPYPRPAR